MILHRNEKRNAGTVLHGMAVLIITSLFLVCLHQSAGAQQKTFANPEEAVKSLIAAVKINDMNEMLAILGPGGKDVISSGDEVADTAMKKLFVKNFETKHSVEKENDNKATLIIGKDKWPFPIPLVKKNETWLFDTMAGKDELLNRRAGRNEMSAILVCHAYVDAQREYVGKDYDGDGYLEYAQKFRSTPEKKDGLYWESEKGEEQSPMGPYIARAVKEGYGGMKTADKPVPYRGYYYKILKAQGESAPGGTYDYMVYDNMVGGFAMVAYPAEYGNSGVMTFIVNQDGVVYQKDLGKDTEKIAQNMKTFNPDKTWKKEK